MKPEKDKVKKGDTNIGKVETAVFKIPENKKSGRKTSYNTENKIHIQHIYTTQKI